MTAVNHSLAVVLDTLPDMGDQDYRNGDDVLKSIDWTLRRLTDLIEKAVAPPIIVPAQTPTYCLLCFGPVPLLESVKTVWVTLPNGQEISRYVHNECP